MGAQLELSLPAGCRVLNFGVSGYGIDQMYLRYVKDVTAWHPNVVILSFIDHDLLRTMSLYGFLLFHMSDTPFPKPRFIIEGGRLSVINYPPDIHARGIGHAVYSGSSRYYV